MKYFKLQILLVVLIILGSFPGIYANVVQDNNNGRSVSKVNDISVNGAKTIYVAKNGTDRNDGLTPGKPKRNIVNAISAADSGDTIKVAPGTYDDNLQIDKNITLIGDTQDNTIVDGQNRKNCIYISGGFTVTIANLTLKNGRIGNVSGRYINGGGIHNKGTLTLENSTITNATSGYGGGVYNVGTIIIKGVTIKDSNATISGGGIYNAGTLTVEDSVITNNTSEWGGGIYNVCRAALRRVTIKNNGAGGIRNNDLLTVEDSVITNNTSLEDGGGIYNSAQLYVYGSTITNNKAEEGGGIFNSMIDRSRIYMDDVTVLTGNLPNNFAGKPFIPA